MKVLIVGGGQVGAYLASMLIEAGHSVTVVEERESRLPALKRDIPEKLISLGNGTDPKFLESVGIRSVDVVAAVTGADETNLVVATIARMEYGVKRVVARVNNPKNKWLFTPQMGVDVAVNQADLMAHLVAEEMNMGDMMTLLKLHRGRYSLVEKTLDESSPAIGKPLRDLHLPNTCVLVAVMRDSQLILPRGDTVLNADDRVMAITQDASAQALADALGAHS